jgi:hypothetical protein
MKNILSLVGFVVLAVATVTVTTHAKAMTWTGWISDSACGAKGSNADHAACAQKCVKEKGASWVFVNGKTKAVVPIHNQDAVNADNDLGHQVKVTGTTQADGSLQVTSITAAGMAKAGNM